MTPEPPTTVEQRTLAQLSEIWQRYQPKMIARLGVIEDATTALIEGKLTEDLRKPACAEAHKLAGTLGSFGFSTASQLAKKMELILLSHSSRLRQEEALRLSEHLVALRAELLGATTPQTDVSALAGAPLLLVISADRDFCEGVLVEAIGWRLRTEMAADLLGARAAIATATPDAVLLDLACDSGKDQCWAFLQELTSGAAHLPVAVLAPPSGFADRLHAARAGARAFLESPVGFTEALQLLLELLRNRALSGTRALAVTENSNLMGAIENALAPLGMSITILRDPLQMGTAMEESNPELLLLDADLPGVSGIDLCRTVRNDPRWRAMPVVLLSHDLSSGTLDRIFSAGADDYLLEPVSAAALAACVQNRIQRIRALHGSAEFDAFTGLATRHKSGQVIDYFLRLATRHRVPVCLALLELDGLAARHHAPQHAEIMRHLARRLLAWFRREDIAGHWDGERLVLAMYGMNRQTGLHRLVDLLERWREERFPAADGRSFHASFSAGVAQYPEDGIDLHNLLQAAEAALVSAQTSGGNLIVPAGWQEESEQPAQAVDVVVVDDDEALVALLLPSLNNRGYRTASFPDGEQALQALTGRDAQLSTKVVLLDVEMPGLDGYSILRRFAETGLLQRTRVIMFTVRAQEGEVVAALQGGAFDHVSKPFSIPVLMERVRRALEV